MYKGLYVSQHLTHANLDMVYQVCITSDSWDAWLVLMSVGCGFAVGFCWFLRVHIAQRRWPATYLVAPGIVWAAQWVGISSWILQDANLGRERGEEREAACCGTVARPDLPLWQQPGLPRSVMKSQAKSSLWQKRNCSASLLAHRTESLQGVTSQFLLWVRNANEKVLK